MITKELTHTNLLGETITRDYYFNLTKADVYEINMLANLEVIAATSEPEKILPVFKKIISRAYGERSDDGREHVRTERLSEIFLGSAAFGELFVAFIEDPAFASKFISELMPAGMKESIARASANGAINTVSPENQQKLDSEAQRLADFQASHGAIIENSVPLPPEEQ